VMVSTIRLMILTSEKSTHMAFLFFNSHTMPQSDRV
jgi:hypothetical protein